MNPAAELYARRGSDDLRHVRAYVIPKLDGQDHSRRNRHLHSGADVGQSQNFTSPGEKREIAERLKGVLRSSAFHPANPTAGGHERSHRRRPRAGVQQEIVMNQVAARSERGLGAALRNQQIIEAQHVANFAGQLLVEVFAKHTAYGRAGLESSAGRIGTVTGCRVDRNAVASKCAYLGLSHTKGRHECQSEEIFENRLHPASLSTGFPHGFTTLMRMVVDCPPCVIVSVTCIPSSMLNGTKALIWYTPTRPGDNPAKFDWSTLRPGVT